MSAVPALALGIVIGGTMASREWEDAVKRLAMRVMERRGDVTSPLAVNVVFHIPGEVVGFDFQGIRTGRFSKKDSCVLIKVALPPSPPDDADAAARRCLDDAVDLAGEFGRQRGLVDDGLAEIRGILDRL